VHLWGPDAARLATLQHERENRQYLPGIRFPERLHTRDDLAGVCRESVDFLVAVPSHAFRVTLAALAPHRRDGTMLAWTGPKTIAEHYIPKISAAAEAAGRERPRVCVLLPVVVTDDEATARQQAATTFEMYSRLPNYQRVLEREGAKTPADLAMVGDEASVERQLRALSDAGADDVIAWVYPVGQDQTMERTWKFLGSLAGAMRAP